MQNLNHALANVRSKSQLQDATFHTLLGEIGLIVSLF